MTKEPQQEPQQEPQGSQEQVMLDTIRSSLAAEREWMLEQLKDLKQELQHMNTPPRSSFAPQTPAASGIEAAIYDHLKEKR